MLQFFKLDQGQLKMPWEIFCVGMVFRRIKSQHFIEELQTDGHHPLKILADDGSVYFCKYMTQMKREEIDCLFYELACHALLVWLGIPSPELAFMEVDPQHLDPNKITFNRKLLRQKTWVLAVKMLPDTELVTGLNHLSKKSQLNKFLDPYLLIKIAFFDLWVDNTDRGVNRDRVENYNLLVHSQIDGNKVRFTWVPIDHAFCFGGLPLLRILNHTFMPEPAHKLVESPYFQQYFRLLNRDRLDSTVDNFLPLSSVSEVGGIISMVYSQLPEDWRIPEHVSVRLVGFLSDTSRVQRARYLIKESLKSK